MRPGIGMRFDGGLFESLGIQPHSRNPSPPSSSTLVTLTPREGYAFHHP